MRHPQTQGKVERFHGERERALQRRGWQGKSPQQWLDEFRWEHNQVRPHEALQMRTPASAVAIKPKCATLPGASAALGVSGGSAGAAAGWRRQAECLRTQLEHRAGAAPGMGATGRVRENRVLVYYCRSVVRELDLSIQRSTAVER